MSEEAAMFQSLATTYIRLAAPKKELIYARFKLISGLRMGLGALTAANPEEIALSASKKELANFLKILSCRPEARPVQEKAILRMMETAESQVSFSLRSSDLLEIRDAFFCIGIFDVDLFFPGRNDPTGGTRELWFVGEDGNSRGLA